MLLPIAAKAGFQYVMLLRILQGLVEVSSWAGCLQAQNCTLAPSRAIVVPISTRSPSGSKPVWPLGMRRFRLRAPSACWAKSASLLPRAGEPELDWRSRGEVAPTSGRARKPPSIYIEAECLIWSTFGANVACWHSSAANWLAGLLADRPTYWLTGWLTSWPAGWLAGWPTGPGVHPPTCISINLNCRPTAASRATLGGARNAALAPTLGGAARVRRREGPKKMIRAPVGRPSDGQRALVGSAGRARSRWAGWVTLLALGRRHSQLWCEPSPSDAWWSRRHRDNPLGATFGRAVWKACRPRRDWRANRSLSQLPPPPTRHQWNPLTGERERIRVQFKLAAAARGAGHGCNLRGRLAFLSLPSPPSWTAAPTPSSYAHPASSEPKQNRASVSWPSHLNGASAPVCQWTWPGGWGAPTPAQKWGLPSRVESSRVAKNTLVCANEQSLV